MLIEAMRFGPQMLCYTALASYAQVACYRTACHWDLVPLLRGNWAFQYHVTTIVAGTTVPATRCGWCPARPASAACASFVDKQARLAQR